MKDAIQKAIEGGWLKDAHVESNEHGHWLVMPDNSTSPFLTYKDCVLVPGFWQALGSVESLVGGMVNGYYQVGWKYQWHRFIDHIAEGKDTDSFFKELLK